MEPQRQPHRRTTVMDVTFGSVGTGPGCRAKRAGCPSAHEVDERAATQNQRWTSSLQRKKRSCRPLTWLLIDVNTNEPETCTIQMEALQSALGCHAGCSAAVKCGPTRSPADWNQTRLSHRCRVDERLQPRASLRQYQEHEDRNAAHASLARHDRAASTQNKRRPGGAQCRRNRCA